MLHVEQSWLEESVELCEELGIVEIVFGDKLKQRIEREHSNHAASAVGSTQEIKQDERMREMNHHFLTQQLQDAFGNRVVVLKLGSSETSCKCEGYLEQRSPASRKRRTIRFQIVEIRRLFLDTFHSSGSGSSGSSLLSLARLCIVLRTFLSLVALALCIEHVDCNIQIVNILC
jgi:hypothetical protein